MNRYQTKQLYTWAGAFCLFVAFFVTFAFLAFVAWPVAATFLFAVVGAALLWRAGQIKPYRDELRAKYHRARAEYWHATGRGREDA